MGRKKQQGYANRVRDSLHARMNDATEEATEFLKSASAFDIAVELSKLGLQTVNRSSIFTAIESTIAAKDGSPKSLGERVSRALMDTWESEYAHRGKLLFEDRIFLICVANHYLSEWALAGLSRKHGGSFPFASSPIGILTQRLFE